MEVDENSLRSFGAAVSGVFAVWTYASFEHGHEVLGRSQFSAAFWAFHMFFLQECAELLQVHSFGFEAGSFLDQLVCSESSVAVTALRHGVFEVLNVS